MRSTTTKSFSLLLAFLGLASFESLAHHGAIGAPGFYLTDELIEIEGEIVDVLWKNPHVRLRVRVDQPDGSIKIWELEGATPNMYRRADITADRVHVGDPIKAAGYVSRANADSLAMLHLLVADQAEFVIGNRAPMWPGGRLERLTPGDIVTEVDPVKAAAAARAAEGIFRVWTSPSLTEFGSLTPAVERLTATAREARERYRPGTDSPELQCQTGMPWTMWDPTPLQFVRDGDRLLLRVQEYDIERVIHMNGAVPTDDLAPSPLGYSVGRREGISLVIRTTGVSFPYFDLSGTPQSEQAEFTERFTLSEDERRLDYTLTVVDPVNLVGPITVQRFWIWVPGVEFEPFECVLWDE